MYVGRIVSIAMSPEGKPAALYRVSSRSFPNREARESGGVVSIMPRKGFEEDLNKSPYIAYNCLKTVGTFAIASNGSHTDPIAEKIASGMSVRDALALGLLAMDYEKDDYNTPRIAAVINSRDNSAFLATVRKDALIVREFGLEPGTAYYVATYEKNSPEGKNIDSSYDAVSAAQACEYITSKGVFAELEKPVTAAAAVWTGDIFETGTFTV
jgi:IMP cyclohydrolase